MNPWLLAYLISVVLYIITQVILVLSVREKAKYVIAKASILEGRKKKIISTVTATQRFVAGVQIVIFGIIPIVNLVIMGFFLLTLDEISEKTVKANLNNGTFKLVDCEE